MDWNLHLRDHPLANTIRNAQMYPWCIISHIQEWIKEPKTCHFSKQTRFYQPFICKFLNYSNWNNKTAFWQSNSTLIWLNKISLI